MRNNWWKIVGAVLVFYTIIWGFLGEVPARFILNESIRATYFHVTMWFSMIILMTASLVFSIRYLSKGTQMLDLKAKETATTGLLFSILGLITGSFWAKFTWGAFWVGDAKLNGTAITLLIYAAYFVLRGSVDDPGKKARLGAVYNIFAFVMMIVFIGILPRMADSLHPGNGGNPAFGQYDMDNQMRSVFYPAVIGFTLIGVWITTLRIRTQQLIWKKES